MTRSCTHDAAEKLDIPTHGVFMRYSSIEKILEAVADKEWQKQREEYDQLMRKTTIITTKPPSFGVDTPFLFMYKSKEERMGLLTIGLYC